MRKEVKRMNVTNNIFLTGATGVLGGRLLVELLSSTTADIYCLTRDCDYDAAKERIKKIFQVYDPDRQHRGQFESRVIPVPGDIAKPYLGLKPDLYKELAQKIDLVIHSAANVRLFSSYQYLKPVNVAGTARITGFCLLGNTPLVYVSTFATLGDKVYEKGFIFYENDLDVGQSFKNLNYARSKFEAEKTVRNAGMKGLKWLIVRPGDIFGDSQTGAYPLGATTVQGFFYEIFRAVIETGYSPFSEESFDFSPVDYVAKATLHLALTPNAYGKTFHLVNPVHKCFYEIMNSLIDYGYKIRMLPLMEMINVFKEHRMVRAGKIYSSIFTNMMAFIPEPELYETARYDTLTTLKFFKNTDIRCPEADFELLSTYLDYCIKIGYLPSPEKQRTLAQIRP
jgi:thioester reductase-like protein